jgi:Ser/Thr protein kinase RdoA (MazF antagonist)
MIGATLLQHVPGCEDGEAPYSQEPIGGGKVNRSFLVRTRRGRFVLRLNENATSDPGLDRAELALHTAAANAGIAPGVCADPDSA